MTPSWWSGRGLIKHPDYLSAHIVLGRCHLRRRDDAAALATFEKCWASTPKTSSP
jgi:hypothetical protein